MKKSTIAEIRERFDGDVERFSNLDTGQKTTIDASLSLELITESAKRLVPNATHLLDVGCGAGNYTIKMLDKISHLNCTLVDLSRPMLDKAISRIKNYHPASLIAIQGDVRKVKLEEGKFDIILAGAVLHHLREEEDWENTFAKLYRLLRPGGCLMISDLISQETSALRDLFWGKYGDCIESIGGPEYRKKVYEYIEKEDSPRSMSYQLELMKKVGFSKTEILHKNLCFGAFGGIK